jgi:hypothetical protein
MKLTVKDKDFLERLKSLLEAKELSIELKEDGYKRLVLRHNYGDKVGKNFRYVPAGSPLAFLSVVQRSLH